MGLYDRSYMRDEDENDEVGMRKIIVILSLCAAVIGASTLLIKEFRKFTKVVKPSVSQSTSHGPSRHDKLMAISPLDLNTASHDDLRLLPNVGERMAIGIAAERPITSVEQLDDVYGIGEKKLAEIRPHVFVDMETLARRYPDHKSIDEQVTKAEHVDQ